MGHNWQDPAFASQWDARHLAGNPARAEHLALLLAAFDGVPPGWTLDLGCGSGLVAQEILDRFPGARVQGIDSSPAMLSLARDRLRPYGDRALLADGDLAAIDEVDAPSPCVAAVAVQSLHHLTESQHEAVVRWTFDHLAPGGWFFIIDRLAVPSAALYSVFYQVRERQGQSPNPASWPEYLAWLEANGDRPQSVQVILRLLERAGFAAAAIDVRGDRGMLAGRRSA